MIGKVLLAATLAGLAVAGCTLAGDITPPPGSSLTGPNTQPTVSTAPLQAPDELPDIANGGAIYAERCEPCHGPDGLGGGSQAADLPNEPALLGEPELARSAVPGSWYEVVTNGRIDQFMPGFSSLTEQERWDVVWYSLMLSVEQESLAHAETVYAQECAQCHGPDGGGGGQGPALARTDLLAGRSRADLFQAISAGLLPEMPRFADNLAEDSRWALAAYLQTLRGNAQDLEQAAPPGGPDAGVETLQGRVVGQVRNGTQGFSVSSGLEVTLRGFDGQQHVLTETVETNARGEYALDGLEIVSGRLFIASVDYGGIRYASEVLHLNSAGEPLKLPVTVFETTTDPSAVRADQVHVLLDYPEPDVLRVIELWVLHNLGDRTLVPYSGGGGIEIPLPEGAQNLRIEDSSPVERFQVIPGGFAYEPALRPGQPGIQIVFSFDMPYPRALDFRQEVPYEVGMVTILVPERGPELLASGLEDLGPRQVTDQVVHHYNYNLQAGRPLEFQIRGRAPGNTILPGGSDPGLLVGAAAFLAVISGVALWLKLWQREEPGHGGEPENGLALFLGDERQRLLALIAQLDGEFEGGELAESEYHLRRKSLKTELMRHMKDSQGT